MIRFVLAAVTLVVGFFSGIGTGALIYDETPSMHLILKCPIEDGRYEEHSLDFEAENGGTLNLQCGHYEE